MTWIALAAAGVALASAGAANLVLQAAVRENRQLRADLDASRQALLMAYEIGENARDVDQTVIGYQASLN